MIEQIKKLRVRIDGISQLVKELKPLYEEVATFDNDQPYEKKLKRNYITNDEHLCIIPTVNTLLFKIDRVNSAELNKCYDSVILAKAWLGKALGELGEETPYSNDGKRKEVQDIERSTDKAFQVNGEDLKIKLENGAIEKAIPDYYGGPGDHPMGNIWRNITHIERVDWLREEVKSCFNKFKELHIRREVFMTTVISIEQHLTEARFWLGFELGRIRDNK